MTSTWSRRLCVLGGLLLVLSTVPAQQTGDFDADGSVDFSDFLLFAGAFGTSDSAYDLDASGSVDFPDFLIFVQAFRDHNGIVDPVVEPVDPVSVFEGVVDIQSETDLDAFLERATPEGYEIAGDLRISGTQLRNLSKLASLGCVEGDLSVENNGLLESLSGLDRILRVGQDLQILRNASLTTLRGVDHLQAVEGDLVLRDNPELQTVSHLAELKTITGLVSVRDNPTLESLIGFDGVQSVAGSVLIEGNASLTSLVGLQNLGTVGQIISIRDNESLETLEGLDRLSSAQGLVITGNASLLPSEAEFLFDQLVLRGFTGLTTIAENNVSADLTIVDGSFFATTMAELEELRSMGGDRFMIDGSLKVSGPDITHMEPLLTLVEVTGTLEIDRNPQLVNLDGLFSLRTVGGSLEVKGNTALRSLTGINRVRTVKSHLVVFRNQRLENLRALRRLQIVGEAIDIRENTVMPDSIITAFRDTMKARGFEGQFTSVNNGP